MEPWYRVVTPRKEVREGRSFNPDEFAIALEQVVTGKAPEDYRDPVQFFARTCFTRALRDHASLALRRLASKTENTAPVLALITQFGGGKTHTLTTLYHAVRSPDRSKSNDGVQSLLKEAGLPEIPQARVAVFVGNAWDPSEGNETPWIDVARQLAGDVGVRALGPEARSKAPGTNNLRALYEAAGGSVLVLCDEVLNYLSRHRDRAEAFRDFLGNLVRSMTGATGCAAVLSLPQSKPEMSDYDLRWQEIISREVGRVAKQLIVNDEAEIGEVVRRRLFEDLGGEKLRKNVAREFADWCFERRAQLPPEWTAVDSTSTEKKAREYLQNRIEACYPFHPATLSVFQRKWQPLPQYQQTRGTLAMLAQWVSWAQKDGFQKARTEPLITLGSAPLDLPEFRSLVLSQLGEARLATAIEVDIAGATAHSRVLDADTKGPLKDIHRRVGAAILFESSGGQIDKVAHLPDLRFALGEPGLDTTSIDNAALALESKSFFIQRVGSDGFKLFHKAKIDKAVNDRRASLDEGSEIRPTLRKLVEGEFERGRTVPMVPFPSDSASIQDSPRLTLVVIDPEEEWAEKGSLRARLAEWTKQRGQSPRLYPGSLVWCARKPGRDLRERVELLLAWKRVQREVNEGLLGADYDRVDKAEIQAKVADADENARDEVWAGYRFVVLADAPEPDGLKVIDLGAGHSGSKETLCGRIIAALKSEALLNESVGAGYIERNWPPALKESGAWPLSGLRQAFVNGTLTRLLDPDATLRSKIAEFVGKGEFGLGSGRRPDGGCERVWFDELMAPDEVTFEPDVFLLRKAKAGELRQGRPSPGPEPSPPTSTPVTIPVPGGGPEPGLGPTPAPGPITRTIRVLGSVPPELWNRLGTKVIPRLRSGGELTLGVEFVVAVDATAAQSLVLELRQLLGDLGVADRVKVEEA